MILQGFLEEAQVGLWSDQDLFPVRKFGSFVWEKVEGAQASESGRCESESCLYRLLAM